jgi:hypothetical protein
MVMKQSKMRSSGVGSGGGTGSNKVVKPGVRYGSQTANKPNVGAVGQIGVSQGGKTKGEGHHSSVNSAEKLMGGKARNPVPFGNQVALNSKSAPGQGRTIYESGSQHGLRPAQSLPKGHDILNDYGPNKRPG